MVDPDEENWTKIIGRGGLYHCRQEFYNFLLAVEQVTKCAITEEGNRLRDGFSGRAETKIKK